MTDCKWMVDEFCVNADCPMCADYCPVADYPGVCRFEEIAEDEVDEQTKQKLSKEILSFVHGLIRIADEGNYDRDSLIKASVDMVATMAEISTFREYQMEGVHGNG